jgi:hypothetical protein
MPEHRFYTDAIGFMEQNNDIYTTLLGMCRNVYWRFIHAYIRVYARIQAYTESPAFWAVTPYTQKVAQSLCIGERITLAHLDHLTLLPVKSLGHVHSTLALGKSNITNESHDKGQLGVARVTMTIFSDLQLSDRHCLNGL